MAAARRALIVEDEAAWRLGMEKRLRLDLFETRGAASCAAALRLMRAWRPHLVVLDLALAGASGLELLRSKRLDPRLARTPVLVVTASQDLETLALVHSRGAGACLSKPFQRERLSALARDLVHRGTTP